MRKKLLLVLGMSLALGLGNGITASAAGWAMENGRWVFYDNSGYMVTNEWKKGADDKWRYLNSSGQMAVDCWVDETYYVDSNGIMVSGRWQKLSSNYSGPTDGDHWYYFVDSGKAVMNAWKKINEKWYHFDWDGAMETGWMDGNMYYANDDGAALVGWHKLYPPEGEADEQNDPFEDDERRWYYFNSSGKKYVPDLPGDARCGEKRIDGNYYCFNSYGAMQTGWAYLGGGSSSSGIDGYRFYDNNGKAVTGWYSAYPPSEISGYDDEVEWFYFSKSGVPKTGPSKGTASTKDFLKINGKTYLFNELGNPVTGLQRVYTNESSEQYTSYYFDESSCAVMSGRMTIEEADGNRCQYYFSANGRGFSGVQGGYLYYLGKQQAAESDTKYEIITIPGENGKHTNYLVNESGRVVKSASGVKDTNDIKYSTNSNGVLTKIDGAAVDAGATFRQPREPVWE